MCPKAPALAEGAKTVLSTVSSLLHLSLHHCCTAAMLIRRCCSITAASHCCSIFAASLLLHSCYITLAAAPSLLFYHVRHECMAAALPLLKYSRLLHRSCCLLPCCGTGPPVGAPRAPVHQGPWHIQDTNSQRHTAGLQSDPHAEHTQPTRCALLQGG